MVPGEDGRQSTWQAPPFSYTATLDAAIAQRKDIFRLRTNGHTIAALLLIGVMLSACGIRSASTTAGPNDSNLAERSSPVAASPNGHPTNLHIQAALVQLGNHQADHQNSSNPYQGVPLKLIAASEGYDSQLQLMALGSAALISRGYWNRVLYLIRDGRVHELDGLNGYNRRADAPPARWVAGGTWPDEVWMALSQSSDGGPSWSWIYRWIPTAPQDTPAQDGHWALWREHEESVGHIIPWRGGVVVIGDGTHLVFPSHVVTWVTAAQTIRLSPRACAGLLPWDKRDGALFGFGYWCGEEFPKGVPQIQSLLQYQSNAHGKLIVHHIALPESLRHDDLRLFVESGQLLVIKTKEDAGPRFFRLEGEYWVTAGELPKSFVAIESSDHTPWGLSSGQLLRWQHSRWEQVAYLPSSRYGDAARCTPALDDSDLRVWTQGESDIWLMMSDQNCGQLWSTVSSDGTFELADAVTSGLSAKRSESENKCQDIMVDVIVLNGDPINGTSWEMSASRGRALIQKALRTHPEFRQLPFFRYRSFGYDCIGARVPDSKTGEALRNAVGSEQYDHNCASPTQCGSHPGSQPFPINQ